jgi:hypothetical protein
VNGEPEFARLWPVSNFERAWLVGIRQMPVRAAGILLQRPAYPDEQPYLQGDTLDRRSRLFSADSSGDWNGDAFYSSSLSSQN